MKSDFIPPIREATFKLWLAKQDPDYVGESFSGEHCPLAQWLSDCGVASAYVSHTHAGNIFREMRKLPRWASAFAQGVDYVGSAKAGGNTWAQPITRAEAFEVLELVRDGAWE